LFGDLPAREKRRHCKVADPSADQHAPCPTCEGSNKAKTKKDRDAKVAKITEKLDPKLQADVEKSPSLQRDLADLQDKGWTVRQDPSMTPPTTGLTNPTTKEITLASDSDTSSLAHEVQHAENFENGRFQAPAIGDMSRSDYVSAATQASVADERSAFDYQNQVKGEILENGGRYIGPTRNFDTIYRDAYTDYYTTQYGKVYDASGRGGK
jgi:hypothetical protein